MSYTTDDAYGEGFRDGERNMAGDIAKLKSERADLIAVIKKVYYNTRGNNYEVFDLTRAALVRMGEP